LAVLPLQLFKPGNPNGSFLLPVTLPKQESKIPQNRFHLAWCCARCFQSQEEKECILQDMNRVYAFCAFAFSCFIAQLGFVLKWHFFEDACSASGKNCLDLLTSASLEAIDTGNQGTSKKLEEGPRLIPDW